METLRWIMEVGSVFAAAIAGGLDARRKQMDFVGVYFVALATALGGGTMRDTLLGRFPVFWARDAGFPLYVLVFSLMVVLLWRKHLSDHRHVQRTVNICDAVGLGLFSMVGASYASEAGSPFFSAVLIGVVNGIVGGVLKDVLCNEIPSVFRVNTQLYATCSFVGCIIYLGLQELGLTPASAFGIGVTFTVVLRLVAIQFRIGLPI